MLVANANQWPVVHTHGTKRTLITVQTMANPIALLHHSMAVPYETTSCLVCQSVSALKNPTDRLIPAAVHVTPHLVMHSRERQRLELLRRASTLSRHPKTEATPLSFR